MLIKQILKAKKGRKRILRILKDGNDKGTLVIVVITEDLELLSYAEKYYPHLLSENKFCKKILLYSKKDNPLCRLDFDEVYKMRTKHLKQILAFYCLYQFSQTIFFLTLDAPDCCKLGKLVQHGLLTKKEAVAKGIYNLRRM